MRPASQHAPGLPNRLPDQPVVLDRQGRYVSGGRPASFQKVLNSLLSHQAEELTRRGRVKG